MIGSNPEQLTSRCATPASLNCSACSLICISLCYYFVEIAALRQSSRNRRGLLNWTENRIVLNWTAKEVGLELRWKLKRRLQKKKQHGILRKHGHGNEIISRLSDCQPLLSLYVNGVDAAELYSLTPLCLQSSSSPTSWAKVNNTWDFGKALVCFNIESNSETWSRDISLALRRRTEPTNTLALESLITLYAVASSVIMFKGPLCKIYRAVFNRNAI